jgi:hypothetical protein
MNDEKNDGNSHNRRPSDGFLGGKWGVIGSIILALITLAALYASFRPQHFRPIPQAVEDR